MEEGRCRDERAKPRGAHLERSADGGNNLRDLVVGREAGTTQLAVDNLVVNSHLKGARCRRCRLVMEERGKRGFNKREVRVTAKERMKRGKMPEKGGGTWQ